MDRETAGEATNNELCRIELAEGRCLRLLEESDAPKLYAVIEANRGYLACWMPWAAGQTFEDTLAFIQRTREQLANNDGLQTAVIVDGRIVGMVGFHGVSWDHRRAVAHTDAAALREAGGPVVRPLEAIRGLHVFNPVTRISR